MEFIQQMNAPNELNLHCTIHARIHKHTHAELFKYIPFVYVLSYNSMLLLQTILLEFHTEMSSSAIQRIFLLFCLRYIWFAIIIN